MHTTLGILKTESNCVHTDHFNTLDDNTVPLYIYEFLHANSTSQILLLSGQI